MFMNVFRITGDVCHLLSFVVMFWKLKTSQSVAGISLKTQELYVMVFLARYLDLFWNFLSYYNVVMKVRAADAARRARVGCARHAPGEASSACPPRGDR